MKIKAKKIMAMICLVLILITSLPMNAFAAFITDINSNAEFGVISGTYAKCGHELHYANYDGQTYLVFCVERGVKSPSGEYVYNGNFIAEYKNNRPEYERIAEMIYFGYTMHYGTGLPINDEQYRAACCTQQYVWEYIRNNINNSYPNTDRDSWNGSFMSSALYANWLSRTEGLYNQYHGNTSFNGVTEKVELGQTKSVTDSSGRLASYKSFNQNINGITFNHNQGSNELNITVSSDCKTDRVTFKSRDYGLYQLLPNGIEYNSGTMSNYVYFRFSSGAIQNLMFSNYVDPSEFNINVEVEYGNALLIKTNSVGNSLAGAKFGLYKDKNCTQSIRTGTSDGNGQIQFNRLAPGIYYVKEISVPTGYLLDTEVKSVQVKANETAQVSFKNDEPTAELKLEKTDVETGNKNRIDGTSHHGDATLNDTEYTLYAESDIYNVAKTVKYFSANEEIANFTFDSNGIASIIITTKSTNANLTTDGATIKGLPIGTYYVKETKVPNGYLQDNNVHKYSLDYKDMNTPVVKREDVLTNKVQKAKFEVIKVSSITNTTAPIIENAEFTAILTKYVDFYGSFDEALKHIDEYSKDEYSIFKTGTNGHGISGLLAYGKYTVNETYCPNDKINPVQEFYVTIDKNSDGVIKELVENDTPFQSYIKMIKIDKNTGKKVIFSNTTFSLFKLNETTNEWERVKCKVGKTSYDTWKTDETAIAYTETKLDAGTYKIDEIEVPTGFLQLEKECIFEVNRSNDTLEYDKEYDAYISVKIENEQPIGNLELNKKVELREGVDTSLVDISDLSGIEFKLLAKENIIDMADGSVIYKKGQEIGTYNLSNDGKLIIEKLPMGTYEIEETKTLKGLVLDTEKHEVKFEQEDQITKVYEKKLDLVNNTTEFEFSKTDITGDKELEGAKLTVFDKDNKEIDSWISSDKSHKIEGLVVGEKYILREEIAPDGYVKATDIQFEVKNDKETQKIEMIDKILEVSKTDFVTGEELEGAKLQVTNEEGNIIDEWVSSKEPHKVVGLEEGKKYVLTEITCPYGFEIAEAIEFTVSYERENQKIEMKDMPILSSIRVEKIDKDTGEHIKSNKFVFGIYEDEECTKLIKEVGANIFEGTALFEDLRYGTYYIKENKAPLGYSLSKQIVKVEINENGVFADGVSLEENDGIYSFEYYNTLLPIIQTGKEYTNQILLGIVIVSSIIALAGIIILKKKNK